MTISVALDVLNGKYSYTTQTEVDVFPKVFNSEGSLMKNERLRAQLIGRTDVLDIVKKLFLIPGLDMMTTQQVADYYKVPPATITSILLRNGDEISSDGIETIKIGDARLIQNAIAKKSGKEGSTKFITPDGDEFLLNNNSTRIFSKRAVLRIGMLLRDSEVAEEVRTQLLKCLKSTTPEQKAEDIETEMYVCKHIDALNMKIEDITGVKEVMISKNDVLADMHLTAEPRKLVNRIIRRLAWKGMNREYSAAWCWFAREVNCQKGIYLNGRRKGKDSLLDVIREEEWPDVIKVAVSMCKRMEIDISQMIN